MLNKYFDKEDELCKAEEFEKNKEMLKREKEHARKEKEEKDLTTYNELRKQYLDAEKAYNDFVKEHPTLFYNWFGVSDGEVISPLNKFFNSITW
jgi:peptide methionine sulfoxide reductase MsrA